MYDTILYPYAISNFSVIRYIYMPLSSIDNVCHARHPSCVMCHLSQVYVLSYCHLFLQLERKTA